MNIGEAIKILRTEAHLAQRQPETGIYDAIQLGIEALKAVAFWNHKQLPQHQIHLPGED